jgi:co-chaperonin GroES (HSP10)
MRAVKRMVGDRVLLRVLEEEKVTDGGIALPDNVRTSSSMRAEVVKAGPGKRMRDGTVRETVVEEGQIVLIASDRGYLKVRVGDEELLIGPESNILAVEE